MCLVTSVLSVALLEYYSSTGGTLGYPEEHVVGSLTFVLIVDVVQECSSPRFVSKSLIYFSYPPPHRITSLIIYIVLRRY